MADSVGVALLVVLTFTFADGLISGIGVIAEPDRLRRLDMAPV